MTDDEDKAGQAPSEPARVPSPTPPPPDLSVFDEAMGHYDDPIEALASIVTPAPRPVEEEELRPEDAIEDPAAPSPLHHSQPDLSRAAFGSQPELSRAALGSQPDRDSIPDSEESGPSKAAAIAPDAVASRRARARITLRIPDDDIPVSSPQPPAVEPETDKQLINSAAVVQAMRIIAIGEPSSRSHHEPDEPAQARDKMPSSVDGVPLGESDMEPTWTPASAPPPVVGDEPTMTEEVEVEPEPEEEAVAPPPALVTLPTPVPPPMAPRPRMASVPPVEVATPAAPPVAAYGPLPPVEPPRPRMASLPPVEPPRPRMASLPPVETPPPRPEPVELAEEDVAPDSSRENDKEPATARVPSIEAPPSPKPKPSPSPPQVAPVVVSPEDVLAAVSPAPAPVQAPSRDSVEEVVPEPAEEIEAEELPPAPPPPAPPRKPVAPEPKPALRKEAAVGEDGAPRRRVRPPWEEVFSDDFVRAFPRLTPKQVSLEVTFVEESLGIQRGGVVLDLACGNGQHAVELASRGYNVVGYDLSLTMLALAADEAQERGQKLNFLQGDMREMAFEEMFDAVYSWSTSFGFFDEEKNSSVLRRVHRALRQSGMFLLDLVNRDYIVSRLPTLNWFEGDGCVCIDDAQFDSITSRLRVKRTVMREDGKSREVEYSVRLYALHEIGKMLHEAGFKVVEVSGHPAMAGAYFGADSPRMIILAERR